jgi:hypothetical protein
VSRRQAPSPHPRPSPEVPHPNPSPGGRGARSGGEDLPPLPPGEEDRGGEGAARESAAAALLLLAAASLFAAACSPSRRETAASPSATASAAAASATVTLEAAAATATLRTPSQRASDPRWIAARDEDPAERMRLAAAEGAAGLLEAIGDGGEIAATALLALPFADDAEAALGRLGSLSQTAAPEQRGPVLAAILAIAGQPRRSREALDPEGARACGEAMIALAALASASREERALAVSAARALAEKGYADARRIPGDLDPK